MYIWPSVLWEILCSSNRVTVSVYIVRVFLVHRTSSLLHPHLTVQHSGGHSRCQYCFTKTPEAVLSGERERLAVRPHAKQIRRAQ